MKTRLLILIALAAALIAMPTAALGSSFGSVGNSTTFADSTGEDASAPDMTSVVVTNDDAGNIVFQINISNRPALTSDMFVVLFLNTDQNGATGSRELFGADYVIELDPGNVTLFQWNGSAFPAASSQASLTYSYTAAGATIRVSASDLGKTKKISFGALAASGYATDAAGNPNLANVHTDAAPDPGHGFFSYDVLTKLILSVTAYTTSPKPAKAGTSFSATLAANQNDLAGPAQAGTVTCAATIAFERISAVTHVLTNGVANCVWRIPRAAKGKVIRGTITLTVRGVKVKRSFSSTIG